MSVVIEAVVEAGGVVRTSLPEGTAVRVSAPSEGPKGFTAEFLAEVDAWRAANPHKLRSGEEIDSWLRAERDDWDDE